MLAPPVAYEAKVMLGRLLGVAKQTGEVILMKDKGQKVHCDAGDLANFFGA